MPTVLRALLRRTVLRLEGGYLRTGSRLRLGPGVVLGCRNGKIAFGNDVLLHRGVLLQARTGFITVGNDVSINPYSVIDGLGGVTVGNDVRIAAHVMITAADHGYRDLTVPIRRQPLTTKGIVIEDDVWIGGGAQILDGAHIARGCVIGAGAVVKGKTEPFGIYAGVPARLIKQRGSLVTSA